MATGLLIDKVIGMSDFSVCHKALLPSFHPNGIFQQFDSNYFRKWTARELVVEIELNKLLTS